MSSRRLFKKGQKFKNWTLTRYLGGGGNGEVWSCQNSNGENYAIKLLKKIKPKAYRRFIDETTVIVNNSDIEGLIPIIDKHLPSQLNGEVPFYIMPLAETTENKLNQSPIEEKVNAIIQVAETLSKLHSRKIYHRDIKPDNILFYNSRYSLVDFGLVDYPDKKEVSLNNEELGPKWTMAPEMKRESSTADASKADIYSLAKTQWIFLTNRKKGFDGQYSTESIIDLKKFYPKSYTSPIDNLLISSTDNDPKRRPSISEFIGALQDWKKLAADFHKRNQQQWFEIQTKLFPTSIPQRVIWEDVKDIVKTLKVLCSYDSLNHVFFPRSGGLDLEDVRLSYEEGCIELDFKIIEIIKPKRLLFESFGYDHEWNYFRLETDELKPSGVNLQEEDEGENKNQFDYEVVSELSPGEYYPYYIMEDSSSYKEDYLITDFSRQITRRFRGSYVIFCKRSIYNLTPSTYDGRHNKMTTDEFRDYIQQSINELKEYYKKESYTEKQSSEKNFKQKRKHYIEEDIVYRCGWCGNIVDFEGNELDYQTREYNIRIIKKFGQSVVKKVHGKCCKDKQD
ncbi:MAG TPA: serine/threonine protein kinase [Bacteroidales bacterium]|nr:serine/threonine protein kinase [Bacteroidales bacterium]